MAQRMHNLSKWQFCPEGQALTFPGKPERLVVLEVNCPDEVCFYVSQRSDDVENAPSRLNEVEAGRPVPEWGRPAPADDHSAFETADRREGVHVSFLGICKGRGSFEFMADGEFDLITEGGSAYVFSNDGQAIATHVIAPLIFTRIANRRQRNPHLEMMQYQMRLNQQRMQEELLGEMQRREQALEKRLETYAAQRDEHAPPELVGKARRDRSADGGVEPDAGTSEPPSDESGGGEEVSGKRKKAKPSPEL